MSPNAKIDVHGHFIPPEYVRALHESGHGNPDGMPTIPAWSEELHLKMMQDLNITKSIISVTTPGTHFIEDNHALGRRVTRQCNDYAADLKQRRPEQFGFWASLPLPDISGSLAEIDHVFNKLNADGVAVLTNHHGTYLGDKLYDPVFEELNQRESVVFIHPTTPCIHSLGPALPLPHLPRPMFEFFFDTARAVINLFLSGTVRRCPKITFVVPHLGGAFPPLINRFAGVADILKLPGTDPAVSTQWVKQRLGSQFFFDTAGWSFPEQIKGLLEYVSVNRVLYGSDYPWTPLPVVISSSDEHDKYLLEFFSNEEDRLAICQGNARKLLKITT